MFSKILIANRGEIAVRIIRACKEMGIATVAVHSQADKESLHVSLADESVCVGKALPGESYLRQKDIITAALLTGAQAIHPGYGFLAENADFARLCEENGLVFIGPGADVISRMGDKDAARRLMKKAGVPTVPGTDILSSPEQAAKAAGQIGYPVLIKARAGGGGKGIRLVKGPDELEKAFLTASEEAKNAFGDGGVYMEKYLFPVKHIEVQLLADEGGNVVCLGERECSIQKRNQKLLEEAPSPAISPQLRGKMCEAAAKAAKAAGYTNAGTVEFLLDDENRFYFMEMNTRLQVEHPVSEYVSGVDIVKWQIRIACGVLLNFGQEDIRITGAAIECRINATGSGKVSFLHVPGGPWVRFDTFLYQGYEMLPYYDSMMGKLIVYAKTREEAIRKMKSALCELVVEGVPNNLDEQLEIISDPAFLAGDYHTDFMAKRGE
ncbi:MAG: acetyl-CoA carboxylase biotin carboxylase subunit [Oscillospiraceae bacterium]|nr:acetyl-CoA carboxylase biotin carboxylase subunit [Oscillospiraceae bacterium]HAO69756.1 acetyl-CoA carboxylase biotin carboxylase subunit [Oscillospiraceae bacterium]